MSHTPKFDAKIQSLLSSLKPAKQTCERMGVSWDQDEEEIGWYQHFQVPPSRLAPHTRWQMAIGSYVGYQWWWNKHPETGEPILSSTHPATGIKVLPDKEWFQKDFSSEARDYNLEEPFFEQWRELQLAVPSNAMRNFVEPENSIASVSSGDINSYFVVACNSKNSLYSVSSEGEGMNLVNWTHVANDSYIVSDSDRVYNSTHVLDSAEILNSNFVFYSKDLQNCFFASNQVHKKYLWFDEQLSQEEWEKRRAEVDLSSRSSMREWGTKFAAWLQDDVIWPESYRVNAPGCTGEYIVGCNDCVHCYGLAHGTSHCYWAIHTYDNTERAVFSTGVWSSQDVYYASAIAHCSNIRFSSFLSNCQSVEYSNNLYDCEYCFGCVGLQRKKYHIFNKPYSEDEYWERVDALKCAMLERGEYGEYFPLAYSQSYQPQGGPALYLHTPDSDLPKLGAMDIDPESFEAIGENLARAKEPIPSAKLPDGHTDDMDDWAGKVLIDERFGRRYSLIKPEIDFAKKHGLPLPDTHFIDRVQKLTWLMNGAIFKDQPCDKCGKVIEVAQNKTFKKRTIYCHECHLNYFETR